MNFVKLARGQILVPAGIHQPFHGDAAAWYFDIGAHRDLRLLIGADGQPLGAPFRRAREGLIAMSIRTLLAQNGQLRLLKCGLGCEGRFAQSESKCSSGPKDRRLAHAASSINANAKATSQTIRSRARGEPIQA